jgi:hypothetical protein
VKAVGVPTQEDSLVGQSHKTGKQKQKKGPPVPKKEPAKEDNTRKVENIR